MEEAGICATLVEQATSDAVEYEADIDGMGAEIEAASGAAGGKRVVIAGLKRRRPRTLEFDAGRSDAYIMRQLTTRLDRLAAMLQPQTVPRPAPLKRSTSQPTSDLVLNALSPTTPRGQLEPPSTGVALAVAYARQWRFIASGALAVFGSLTTSDTVRSDILALMKRLYRATTAEDALYSDSTDGASSTMYSDAQRMVKSSFHFQVCKPLLTI